jgi:uncharacterized Tic20 family protein
MESPPNLPTSPQPPPLRASSDENLIIVFCHISLILGLGIILPLIIWLIKKDESPRISWHAKEALNFHISTLIYSAICAITCIGAPLIIVIAIGSLILSIIAAVKVSDEIPYEYPLTLRLIK